MLYTDKDTKRFYALGKDDNLIEEPYRSEWSRDLARLIHCRAFKNLQGKSQLLPNLQTEFFRNRISHSLEVSQVAKSIVEKLNYELAREGLQYNINEKICEFAALAHDIGRPPFAKYGEMALHLKMKDSGGFEGNAQTFRVLTKIAKKHYIPGTVLDTGLTKEGDDLRVGLNLTYRSLASVLKHDNCIPEKLDFDDEQNVKLVKGFYESEAHYVREIKKTCTGNPDYKNFKTIEAQILDIASDIAYATYDIDDAFRTGFVKPLDVISMSDIVLKNITEKINENLNASYKPSEIYDVFLSLFQDLFAKPIHTNEELTDEQDQAVYATSLAISYRSSEKLALNGYYRVNFISKLIGRFIRSIEMGKIVETIPALSKITMSENIRLEIEALKNFMYHSRVTHPNVKLIKHRGQEIVATLFDALTDKNHGADLLPTDILVLFNHAKNEMSRKRIVCDYIAGMTDNQAIELYNKLQSSSLQLGLK
ncbi:MAG: dNTP triphosphohydrolase [Bacteroidales bacterium]